MTRELLGIALSAGIVIGACTTLARPIEVCRDGVTYRLQEYRPNLFYEDLALDLHGRKIPCPALPTVDKEKLK